MEITGRVIHEGGRSGENVEKVQGIRSINGRHKIVVTELSSECKVQHREYSQ